MPSASAFLRSAPLLTSSLAATRYTESKSAYVISPLPIVRGNYRRG